MSSVIGETIEILREKGSVPLRDMAIEDLVVGIFFTGVKLSTGHGGCAFTPVAEIPEAVCCPSSAARMPQAGALEGKNVSEILEYANDPNVLKKRYRGCYGECIDPFCHRIRNRRRLSFARGRGWLRYHGNRAP